MKAPTCDECPGNGRTVDQREYPLPATLRCRLDGSYACGSGHAAKHSYRHRFPKWEPVRAERAAVDSPPAMAPGKADGGAVLTTDELLEALR